MKKRSLLLAGIWVAMGTGLAAQEAYTAQTIPTDLYLDPEILATGAELYQAACAACHGAGLEGAENWRDLNDDGMRQAPPHSADGHTWHHPDFQNYLVTKYGIERLTGIASDMPGFGSIMSDDAILAVLAYIKSTWPADVIEIHNRANQRAAGG